MDLFRPSTCLGRGRREAWITGTSPAMTTRGRGVALGCNHIRGTGQPWVKPGDDDEEQRRCAALQLVPRDRTAVEQIRA